MFRDRTCPHWLERHAATSTAEIGHVGTARRNNTPITIKRKYNLLRRVDDSMKRDFACDEYVVMLVSDIPSAHGETLCVIMNPQEEHLMDVELEVAAVQAKSGMHFVCAVNMESWQFDKLAISEIDTWSILKSSERVRFGEKDVQFQGALCGDDFEVINVCVTHMSWMSWWTH